MNTGHSPQICSSMYSTFPEKETPDTNRLESDIILYLIDERADGIASGENTYFYVVSGDKDDRSLRI